MVLAWGGKEGGEVGGEGGGEEAGSAPSWGGAAPAVAGGWSGPLVPAGREYRRGVRATDFSMTRRAELVTANYERKQDYRSYWIS